MHSAQRILVLCGKNNKRKESGDNNLGHGQWTVPPRAAADALAGSGGQKGGADAWSSAALILAALSGPDAPCHLHRPSGPSVSWTRVCPPLCPLTVTWSSDALTWVGESTSSMVHYSSSRGGEPPAPSVGTGPGALFPRHLLWVPNRNRAGTSGGRWAGRRAVPEPSAAAPPPWRASAAQPGDAAEARRIPAGQRAPPQRRGPGRRVRRLPARSRRPPPPPGAFLGDTAPGLPPR